MLDKMLFVLLEGDPVLSVLSKIDLIDGPEAGHLVFVHLPNVMILDGKDDEAVGVLFEEWLGQDLLSLSTIGKADLGGSNTLGWNDLRAGPAKACVVFVKQLRARSLRIFHLGL